MSSFHNLHEYICMKSVFLCVSKYRTHIVKLYYSFDFFQEKQQKQKLINNKN